MAKKLAAGNWKMNGLKESLIEVKTLADMFPNPTVDVLICPPATLISSMADVLSETAVSVGGQDCHMAESGAHTGDVSAAMLVDAGATYVILGHSERRADHGETNEIVCAKTETALAQGLIAIVCVGETLDQREAGETLTVVRDQLQGSLPNDVDAAKLVVAYEPVWAIGTGLTPTLEQIEEVHNDMRAALTERYGAETADAIPLLYGGSVKPANASEIFGIVDVDGALVGGASLKASDFSGIVSALQDA